MVEDSSPSAQEAHSKPQNEIAAMKREAEQSWAAERVENALLRERINDIAAEIARLTAALEGTGLADRGDARGRARPANACRPRNGNGEAGAGAKAAAASPTASARCKPKRRGFQPSN